MKTKNIFIFLLCIVLFSSSCSHAQHEKTKNVYDWEEYGLRGKVKSIKTTVYDATEEISDNQKGVVNYSNFIIFNENGCIIEKSEYNKDGSLFDKYIYKYNSNNKKIEENRFDSNGKLFNVIVYKYDSKNNLIEEIDNEGITKDMQTTLKSNRGFDNFTTFYSSVFEKIFYNYDIKNNLIEETHYSGDASDYYIKSTWKYDEKGNQIEYNLCMKLSGTSTISNIKHLYKYDTNNNKIEESLQNDASNPYVQFAFKYDGNKNMIEKVCYKKDGSTSFKEIYKYNNENVKIENTSYNSDNSKTIYKYNKDSELIEEIKYNSDNVITKTNKFEMKNVYDANENWIKSTSYENDKPAGSQSYQEREIIYY